jgi:hypothetical protein
MVMQYTTVLDALPLWGLFLVIVVLVLFSIEGGHRLGRYRRTRSEQEKDAPVGAMVGSTLGLLAFMLAFTFGMAASRFDTRKSLVLDEANAIGTTYLRAAMLPDRRGEVRGLLRDYVDARLIALVLDLDRPQEDPDGSQRQLIDVRQSSERAGAVAPRPRHDLSVQGAGADHTADRSPRARTRGRRRPPRQGEPTRAFTRLRA